MRAARHLSLAFSLISPLWLGLAFAQASATPGTPPGTAPSVLNPDAATLALHHSPLPAAMPLAAEVGDWRAAHAAVARFPRGHADVLRWEKAQTPGTAPAQQPIQPVLPSPTGRHHIHGDQP